MTNRLPGVERWSTIPVLAARDRDGHSRPLGLARPVETSPWPKLRVKTFPAGKNPRSLRPHPLNAPCGDPTRRKSKPIVSTQVPRGRHRSTLDRDQEHRIPSTFLSHGCAISTLGLPSSTAVIRCPLPLADTGGIEPHLATFGVSSVGSVQGTDSSTPWLDVRPERSPSEGAAGGSEASLLTLAGRSFRSSP